eukprot:m.450449 g.450449  ORF g.450449 m.450449 type:complete len:215 (-) comp20003_c0_seq1:111-755(-)
MREEIDSAAELAARLMLPTRHSTPDGFRLKASIRKALEARFRGHWYAGNPIKGSGYRALQSTPGFPDKVLLHAYRDAFGDLTDDDLAEVFSLTFVIWCDPEDVSVQLGENGSAWTHWSRGVATETSSGSDSDESDDLTVRFHPSQGHAHGFHGKNKRSGLSELSPSAKAFTPVAAAPAESAHERYSYLSAWAAGDHQTPAGRRRRRSVRQNQMW